MNTAKEESVDQQDHRASQKEPPPSETMVRVCRSARLTPAVYRFYPAILLAFVAHGDTPEPEEVATLARQFNVPHDASLARMAAQDLVQRDLATGRIRAAYPFSGVPTPHQVVLFADHSGEKTDLIETHVFAMCALDALGIPLLLRRAALIISADALSGDIIRVLVRPETMTEPHERASNGWITACKPEGAAVFACPERREEGEEGEQDGGITSASARCPVTTFFATAEQARAWAAAHAETDGVVLTPIEALARAGARFGSVLDRLEEADSASASG